MRHQRALYGYNQNMSHLKKAERSVDCHTSLQTVSSSELRETSPICRRVKINSCSQLWNPVLLGPPWWKPVLGKTLQPHQTGLNLLWSSSKLPQVLWVGGWGLPLSLAFVVGAELQWLEIRTGNQQKCFSEDSSNATVKRIDKGPGSHARTHRQPLSQFWH